MDKTKIILRLQEIMKEKGVSQYQLAKITGISASTLSDNFLNKKDMSLTNFLKILEALEITFEI